MDATDEATTSSVSTSSHPQGVTLQPRHNLNTPPRLPYPVVAPTSQPPPTSRTPVISESSKYPPLTDVQVKSPALHLNSAHARRKAAFFDSSPVWGILHVVVWGGAAKVYLILLFRFPAMYFSRFAHVFEQTHWTKHEANEIIHASRRSAQQPQLNTGERDDETPAGLVRFRECWEQLIETLSREWDTMNIVSVLLLGIDVAMLQIDDIASQASTRAASLLSLLCSLTSLPCGCIYAMRTPSMRTVTESPQWIKETMRHDSIFWNVWVLIAMPAIWLVWSIVFFLLNVMLYTWQTGTELTPMTKRGSIVVRAVVTFTFALQMFYLVLVLVTLVGWSKPPRRPWQLDDLGDAEPSPPQTPTLGFNIPIGHSPPSSSDVPLSTLPPPVENQ